MPSVQYRCNCVYPITPFSRLSQDIATIKLSPDNQFPNLLTSILLIPEQFSWKCPRLILKHSQLNHPNNQSKLLFMGSSHPSTAASARRSWPPARHGHIAPRGRLRVLKYSTYTHRRLYSLNIKDVSILSCNYTECVGHVTHETSAARNGGPEHVTRQ